MKENSSGPDFYRPAGGDRDMKRTASAVWNGSIKDGNGFISTESSVLSDNRYSYKTRFEDERGTNPEELIAAAHAACFSMALSSELGKAGFPPSRIRTSAALELDNTEGTWRVKSIQLETAARIARITPEQFELIAQSAKATCPISQLLKTTITLVAKLED
jgi:osmotically inducible protein OsmC